MDPRRPLAPTALALVLACQPGDPGATEGSASSTPGASTDVEVPTTSASGSSDTATTTDASSTTTTEPRACIGAAPGSAAVTACATQFCAPTTWPVTVSNTAPDPGLGFEWKPPGLITYRHKSATLDLAVHFTDDLGDDRSDAALLAHFAGFSGSIPFPADIVADTPGDVLNAFYSPVGSLEDRLQFTTLAFAEGRLQATWHGELSAAVQHVHSDEETCTDADIAGQCDCIYAPAPFPVDLELDLSIDD